MNDSTTIGFLTPLDDELATDDALRDLLFATIVGITGLDPTLVRPRYQADPMPQPNFDVTWLAFGVTIETPDTFAYEAHDPSGDGTNIVQRNSIVSVPLSFYGPQAERKNAWLRDGIQMSQNRDILRTYGIAVVSYGESVTLPALTRQEFVSRVDATLTLRRQTIRTYGIRNVLSADGIVEVDGTVSVDGRQVPFSTPPLP